MVKIIYLSIYYSNVGLNVRLDYDSIYTILFLFFFKSSFFKKILNFFPLELYSWFFTYLYIVKEKRVTIIMYKVTTSIFAREQPHISIVWFQSLIENFEFDYALDIWLDHITSNMFYLFGRMSLTLVWVLFFPFFFFFLFLIVVLLSFIKFFRYIIWCFGW